MNIVEAFVDYLENKNYGVMGDNLFIGGTPLDAPDDCIWITSGGGLNDIRNITGERRKIYNLSLYVRGSDAKAVYDLMQEIELDINDEFCIEMQDYFNLEVSVLNYPTDNDIDNGERTVGLMAVELIVYR